MNKICAYSGKPMCERCKGPLYVCDPKKNTTCRRNHCMDGFCGHTRKPEFAKDQTPLCPREPKPDHPEQEEIEKGCEKMYDEKEILRKQLQLLSEKSIIASTNMLIELTMEW